MNSSSNRQARADELASSAGWSRNGEFLVYLVPVGGISMERYASYVALLQSHRELPIRALTRPGGYAPELSPFKSFSWQSTGAFRFRFVSTTDRVESCDGEDVHAYNRPIGVFGICHSPSSPSLADAHAQFITAIRHLPGTLVQRCFAFEHAFDDATTIEHVAALSHLVMFPVHHELADGVSTVSCHLQVVLDTVAVTILMSLESTIRAALRQQQTHALGDMASVLLDTNVEPQQAAHHHHHNSLELPAAAAPLVHHTPQSLHATISSMASTAVASTASALAAPFADTSRHRKRHAARQRKLFGDYAVLLTCVPDAFEHYSVALELLRDEERKSQSSNSDVLWLAAALEGFVYCLVLDALSSSTSDSNSNSNSNSHQRTLDVLEKASDALALYARAGTSDLECQLVEKVAGFCVRVVVQTQRSTISSGNERLLEVIWFKRVLWDVVERGLVIFADLQPQRQLEFLAVVGQLLEAVGHKRRMALFLHEAAALLLARSSSSSNVDDGTILSPIQQQHDLQAALALERLTAAQLGMHVDDDSAHATVGAAEWRVTTLDASTKTHRSGGLAATTTGLRENDNGDGAWLVLRLHVLRQLLLIAKRLRDPYLIARYALQLLQLLPSCDALASSSSSSASSSSTSSNQRSRPTSGRSGATKTRIATTMPPIEQAQQPFTLAPHASPRERQGLFTKTSVFYSPPSSIETKSKRFFASPSATMSSAAATLTSTIASTPRIMLAAPQRQFSAAVSAISTKASPAFASFGSSAASTSASTAASAASSASLHGFSNQSLSATTSPNNNGLSSVTSDRALSPLVSPLSGATTNNVSQDASAQTTADTLANSRTPRRLAATAATAADTQLLVWNIRSRSDVVELERSVLRVLATDCASLRPREQQQLATFVRVDALRVVLEQEHPITTKAATLATFSALNSAAATEAPSDFFYSPFDKQAPRAADSAAVATATLETRVFPLHETIELELVVSNPLGVAIEIQQATAWVECVNSSTTTTSSVECYPCTIALQAYETAKRVVLGIQPLAIGTVRIRGVWLKALNLQLSCALATPMELHVVDRLPLAALSVCEAGGLTTATATTTTATPTLRTASLSEGAKLRLCMFTNETKQCTLRIRNTSARAITRCRLAAIVRRRHVAKQTLVVYSNLATAAAAATAVDQSDNAFVVAVETPTISLRCTSLTSSTSSSAIETLVVAPNDAVTLAFELLLHRVSSGSGNDRPFVNELEPLDEVDEIVWSFVYADDRDDEEEEEEEEETKKEGDALTSAPVYYRESVLTLALVSLPSLQLTAATLVPATPARVSTTTSAVVTLDNTHCLLVIQVENPTETAFRFRLRRRRNDDSEESDSDDDGQDHNSSKGCDVEIGRKCSRRLAIEVPRVQLQSLLAASDRTMPAVSTNQQSPTNDVAALLNACVAIEWATYFGTTGALQLTPLLFDAWRHPNRDSCAALRELLVPAFSFTISAVIENDGDEDAADADDNDNDDHSRDVPMLAAATTTTTTGGHSGVDTDLNAAATAWSTQSPFTFFDAPHVASVRRCVNVRALEFVALAFDIRWRAGTHVWMLSGGAGSSNDTTAPLRASIEIRVSQDGHEEDDDAVVRDSVVVSGMLQRELVWPPCSNSDSTDIDTNADATREMNVQYELQLLFLSRGEFCVTIGGRVLPAGSAENAAHRTPHDVWCHEPLYICVTE